MALQGASLIIIKDGVAVSKALAVPSDRAMLRLQRKLMLAGLDLNTQAEDDLDRQEAGLPSALQEDPTDPKISDLRVELVGDHGAKKSLLLYEGEGMSLAQREWVAGFYERVLAQM